jgi:phosphate-selective porin
VSYAVGAFNGTPMNFNYNDNDRFSFVQRLAVVPWRDKESYVQFGGNYYLSDDRAVTNMSSELGLTKNQFMGYRQGGGADLQVHVGPFDLWAEYLRSEFKPDDEKPAARFEAEGWYVMAGWFFVPKKWQAVVRYETFDPRLDSGDNSTASWTFGVNWRLKGDDLKLQLNYVLTDLPGNAPNQSKVLLRLQTVF